MYYRLKIQNQEELRAYRKRESSKKQGLKHTYLWQCLGKPLFLRGNRRNFLRTPKYSRLDSMPKDLLGFSVYRTETFTFNKKSSFFRLSGGDGIVQICQKLGKIQGMFEAWYHDFPFCSSTEWLRCENSNLNLLIFFQHTDTPRVFEKTETVWKGLGILGPTLTIVPFCYHQPNRNPGIEYATEEDELLDKLDGMDIDGDGEDARMMWLIPLPKTCCSGKKRPDLVLTCGRTSLGTTSLYFWKSVNHDGASSLVMESRWPEACNWLQRFLFPQFQSLQMRRSFQNCACRLSAPQIPIPGCARRIRWLPHSGMARRGQLPSFDDLRCQIFARIKSLNILFENPEHAVYNHTTCCVKIQNMLCRDTQHVV